MTSVTVICPNAQRCLVKVTAGMLIKQILEEACLKQGYDVDAYEVRSQKRLIDLSLPFRISGLTNNATLEMVPVNRSFIRNAHIALQLPDGTRKELSIPISDCLFTMLERFSMEVKQDLTAVVESTFPCCVFMNKEFCGHAKLRSTTLSSIGISSGRFLIRYQRLHLSTCEIEKMEKQSAEDNAKKAALNANFIRKKTENEERERIDAERIAKFEEEVRLKQEAKRITTLQDESEMMETDNRERVAVDVHMHSIPYVQHNLASSTQNSNQWSFDAPVFSIPSDTSVLPDRLSSLNRLLEEVDSSLSHGTEDRLVDLLADTGRVPLSQIVQVTSVPHEHSQEQMEINTTVTKPCDRRAVIFMKQPISQLVEDSLISDEFFEVGIEDAKTMQRDLHEQVRLQTQRAILPKSYVDKKNKEAKISSYKNTVIRISVDKSGHYLQAQFHSTEPVSNLFEFVRSLLMDQKREFYLTFALNLKIEQSKTKNFIDYDLAPKSTIFLRFKDTVIADPVFNLDLLTVCEYHEADKFSSDWLSQNTLFKPYTGVESDEGRNIVSKRPAGYTSSSHIDSQPPLKTAVPKWLLRK